MKTVGEIIRGALPWKADAGKCLSNDGFPLVSDGDLRLMTAAPELYEALRLAYEEAVGERIVVPKRGWIERARQALELASCAYSTGSLTGKQAPSN